MGLDMYLTKDVSLWAHQVKEKTITIRGKYESNQHEEKILDLAELKHLSYEAGYWRKANHIHKWFVDHVQNGEDNCEKYYVSRDKLEELLATCKDAIRIWNKTNLSTEEKEKQLAGILPTQAGFFFGNIEYDDYYISSINDTIEIIEKEKRTSTWDDPEVTYYYQSSW